MSTYIDNDGSSKVKYDGSCVPFGKKVLYVIGEISEELHKEIAVNAVKNSYLAKPGSYYYVLLAYVVLKATVLDMHQLSLGSVSFVLSTSIT